MTGSQSTIIGMRRCAIANGRPTAIANGSPCSGLVGPFQLHCRLTLVGGALAKVEERGECIEQAAGAGGDRRVDAARQHRLQGRCARPR